MNFARCIMPNSICFVINPQFSYCNSNKPGLHPMFLWIYHLAGDEPPFSCFDFPTFPTFRKKISRFLPHVWSTIGGPEGPVTPPRGGSPVASFSGALQRGHRCPWGAGGRDAAGGGSPAAAGLRGVTRSDFLERRTSEQTNQQRTENTIL